MRLKKASGIQSNTDFVRYLLKRSEGLQGLELVATVPVHGKGKVRLTKLGRKLFHRKGKADWAPYDIRKGQEPF
jgi:hypothetical protein